MNQDVISNLPVVPEEYDIEWYNRVDYSELHSLMQPSERRFINGLIRYYKPHNILEVGVNLGGGTINILNAISDMPESRLTSIDVLSAKSFPVAIEAKKRFADMLGSKWNLIDGKDPAEVMGEINQTFDFAVIDTAHIHPIECLNFLTVLPFLRDGSIVVLHDIVEYMNVKEFKLNMAPRLLWCSVVGEKLTPVEKIVLQRYENNPVINIGAIQINNDTRKYIVNVFESLFLPWVATVENHSAFISYFSKHYGNDFGQKFVEALKCNMTYLMTGGLTFSHTLIKTVVADNKQILNNHTIFYGAGSNLRKMLAFFTLLEIPFVSTIWDKDAENINEINGHKVDVPKFSEVAVNTTVIITIADRESAEEIRAEFLGRGCNVIFDANLFPTLLENS